MTFYCKQPMGFLTEKGNIYMALLLADCQGTMTAERSHSLIMIPAGLKLALRIKPITPFRRAQGE
jgi:hypothetical protein